MDPNIRLPIDRLPSDIIEYITSYLDNKDYFSCLCSSKIFNLKDLNKVTVHNYLYRKYKNEDIDDLSRLGDLKGVQFLTSTGNFACTDAMDNAAANGHLEIVKWLHENRKDIKGFACTTNAMDYAALNGYLETVKWLHENGYACTTDAMNWAAARGHLEIVKFLHENRKEGFTRYAIIWAENNYHLETVKFLKR